MIDAFRAHNKPLDDAMKAAGNKFAHTEGLSYWVDADGKYVPDPVGYIRGPATDKYRGGFYVSVYLRGGTWAQRSYQPGQEEAARTWALETARKTMTPPPTPTAT
jgi:hypothetical protein